MANGNGIWKPIGIGVTILVVFTSYVVANDVGSRARDEKLDSRVDKVEVAVARIDANLQNMTDDMREQKTMTKEGFAELKQLIREKI